MAVVHLNASIGDPDSLRANYICCSERTQLPLNFVHRNSASFVVFPDTGWAIACAAGSHHLGQTPGLS